MKNGVLDSLRVIEFCEGIAGSAAGLQLSEAGAEVVKVELATRPLKRSGALFSVLNRGKRHVTLASLEGVLTLLESADVLIHELTPAQAAANGLDDASLKRLCPSLVVSAIGGWPQRHALAEAVPRETLVLARLGLLDEQPGHRTGPVFVRMPYANWIACWLCVVGVMARLIARDRDGRGGVAHTSLAQAALVPMSMHWARAETPTPVFAKGLDKHIPIPLHRCSDGRWLHVHYSPDKAPWMASALAQLGPDEVARLNAAWPESHVAPNFGANRYVFAMRPAQEWVEHLWEWDVAAQIAAPFGAVYFDEQARANGYVVEVDDPVLGRTLQPGPCYSVQPASRVRGPLRSTCEDLESIGFRPPVPVAVDKPVCDLPPLHGLKVLDLGAYLAGPFACMLLADLGADVIKVEAPTGDAMRRLERTFSGTQRGKRGVALKLGDAATQPVVEALVRWADVIHHNMRLPAARKLKVDYDSAKALNPTLLYCHVSAYGPNGPRAHWPGFDQLMQASSGWETAQGGEGNPPQWLRFGVGDFFAGLSSLFALLLGVYARNRTGNGQMVASSLLGATLLTMAEAVALDDGSITEVDVLDSTQTGVSTVHRLYLCGDHTWLAVAALQDDEARRLLALLGADPGAWFLTRTRSQAITQLQRHGINVEAVREAQLDAFLDDPMHAAAGLHAHYPHPVYGQLQQVGGFWDFGDLPLALDRAPPALGQHSREVLMQMGFDDSEQQRLVEAGLLHL
ncbi:CoA transferase [Pseudomonas bohemica]|uniref:CoA transferase n=1 Tax=Pseudomonas bohemica TaxID=2044872 RepID=UPI000DA63B85|nr:CoA transferase [Pseudomonas bohemica]